MAGKLSPGSKPGQALGPQCFVSHISGISIFYCLLSLSSKLLFYILCLFIVVLFVVNVAVSGYIQSLLFHLGSKWGLSPFFSPFLYNEICLRRFL